MVKGLEGAYKWILCRVDNGFRFELGCGGSPLVSQTEKLELELKKGLFFDFFMTCDQVQVQKK